MSDLARLLGRPHAVVGGSVLGVPPVKSGALWSFLVHQADWVDRPRLTFLLWPDIPQHRAHVNLRQLLSTLAGTPWGQRLERERHRVRLLLPSDAAEFAGAAAASRQAEALAAYRGRFLDAFYIADAPEFMAWAERERGALYDRWRSLALSAIDQALEARADATAYALAQRLLREDPCDESAARGAMRASLATGDTTRAVRIYRALTTALRDEVGTEPSPATTALTREVLRGSTPASPTQSDTNAPEPAVPERRA
jgi:DNA-binding SARP family transcriptional activator